MFSIYSYTNTPKHIATRGNDIGGTPEEQVHTPVHDTACTAAMMAPSCTDPGEPTLGELHHNK